MFCLPKYLLHYNSLFIKTSNKLTNLDGCPEIVELGKNLGPKLLKNIANHDDLEDGDDLEILKDALGNKFKDNVL